MTAHRPPIEFEAFILEYGEGGQCLFKDAYTGIKVSKHDLNKQDHTQGSHRIATLYATFLSKAVVAGSICKNRKKNGHSSHLRC